MYKIVVTDIHVITRLYRIGLLKYFNSSEVAFYITDLCYGDLNSVFQSDRIFSKRLIDEGILHVVSSDSDDIREVQKYYTVFHPMFVVKTVSAMVFAKRFNYRLLTNDELLSDVAQKKMGLKVSGKEWLVANLVGDIGAMGFNLDEDLIYELI